MRILVADDDRALAQTLRRGLEENGHQVMLAFNGTDALEIAQIQEFDLMVLDVMMPGLDGLNVARRVRGTRNQTPIIMLTARDGVVDMVRGLDQGADDYLTKPFSFQILLARIRAISRRGPIRQPLILHVADLSLDPASHEVYRGSARVVLTPTEFKLLETLMRKSGQVVHREVLLQTVWGFSGEAVDNTLDAFIRLLRQKVDAGSPKLIHTVRTVGYCLRDPTN
jgi:two-component system response regulator MprA